MLFPFREPGKLQPKGNTYIEQGVDVQLAVTMIEFAYRDIYDTATLISGDSDFVSAIQFVEDPGKHIELAAVEGQPCFHLQNICDRVIVLDTTFLASC